MYSELHDYCCLSYQVSLETNSPGSSYNFPYTSISLVVAGAIQPCIFNCWTGPSRHETRHVQDRILQNTFSLSPWLLPVLEAAFPTNVGNAYSFSTFKAHLKMHLCREAVGIVDLVWLQTYIDLTTYYSLQFSFIRCFSLSNLRLYALWSRDLFYVLFLVKCYALVASLFKSILPWLAAKIPVPVFTPDSFTISLSASLSTCS